MAGVPKRKVIVVTCPDCGHAQQEPAMVMSTKCRSCYSNFRVENGKGIAKEVHQMRFSQPSYEFSDTLEPLEKPSYTPGQDPYPIQPPKKNWLQRLMSPDRPPRPVNCWSCDTDFYALGSAQSTQCPKCGKYVNLIDVLVDDSHNRSIETRGTVTITRNGSIHGVPITCGNLIVQGRIDAIINCSETLTIKTRIRSSGKTRCKHLLIEKKGDAEFQQPLICQTAVIRGEFIGQLTATASITLEKGAVLHGPVRTPSLIIKPGARHEGAVEILSTTNLPSDEPTYSPAVSEDPESSL